MAIAAMTLASCGEDKPAAPSTQDAPVDVSALDAADVPAALLAACHADVVGFDRFAAHVTLPDGTKAKALGSLPHRLRIEWPDGKVDLCDGARAFRAPRENEPAAPLDANDAERAFAMRRLLDAAALGPLRRKERCSRVSPTTFRVEARDGIVHEVELEPRALLVASMTQVTPQQEPTVIVRKHLRTSRTRIVRVAETKPLGVCAIRFDAVDFAWDESMFDAQQRPATTSDPQAAKVTLGAPQRPTTPTIESVRAARWLCVADPGDWESRSAFVQRAVAALTEAGQSTAGFPGLARDGDREWLVVPFRANPGAAAWRGMDGAELREAPATRALAVYPPSGDFQERSAAGIAQIDAALRERGLSAAGLVLRQPFFHMDEAVPDEAARENPTVRVSVALR